MPGLVGCISDTSSAARIVGDMALVLGIDSSPDQIHSLNNGSIAIASHELSHSNWGPSVAIDFAGNMAGINGEIFGLYAERNHPSEDFLPGLNTNPAEIVLALYRSQGTSFIPRLRGFFSIVIWDKAQQTLIVATDRFGLRPIYYYRSNNKILFGSEVKALLSACNDLPQTDWHAISDFLLFGMPFGDRTFFHDISLVPPATIIKLSFKSESSMKYWDLRFNGNSKEYSDIDHAADALATALEESLSDSLTGAGNIDIPISGGLDSRCIALGCGDKVPLRSYTFGGPDSVDLQIGPKIANELKIPNIAWSLQARDFIDWIEPSIYLTDGMYSPMNASIMAVAKRLPGDASVVLDGASSFDGSYKAYDVALGKFFPSRYSPSRQLIHICPQPIIDSSARYSRSLFSGDFISSSQRYITETFNERLGEIPKNQQANPFDRIDYLEQSNLTRRFIMMGTVLLRPFAEVRQPFFDYRVIDAVTQLSPLYRSKEKLLIGRLLERSSLPLAHLPYERTGLPANAPLSAQLFEYARRAVARTAGHIIPALHEKPRIPIDYANWIQNDKGLQQLFRDVLLDERSLTRPYINKDFIEPFLSQLFAGRTSDLPLATRLITLEFWHRLFLENASKPTFTRYSQ